MRRALAAVRAHDPKAATEIIREALTRASSPGKSAGPIGPTSIADLSSGEPTPTPEVTFVRRGQGEHVLGALRRLPESRQPRTPERGRYIARHIAGPHGGRDCKLYIPSDRPDGPAGLVIMLHGCAQNADDFALGTDMNRGADEHGLLVVYPEQAQVHNIQRCWNWFRPGDQQRSAGEAAVLADIALQVAHEYETPRDRIFVAGMSAGGAMAAILAATHPDVFAAAGVHSGLPAGCANDLTSAFRAMRGGASSENQIHEIPLIVFHGAADATVAPINARRLVSQDGVETSHFGNGRSWTRLTTETGSELWLVKEAGHAWFGGDPSGSFTDPLGPDATAEMLRFFRESEGLG